MIITILFFVCCVLTFVYGTTFIGQIINGEHPKISDTIMFGIGISGLLTTILFFL